MALMLLVCLFLLWATPAPAQSPIEVKVVVVTMFERGADTGDQPGELQHWVERECSTAWSRFHRAGATCG